MWALRHTRFTTSTGAVAGFVRTHLVGKRRGHCGRELNQDPLLLLCCLLLTSWLVHLVSRGAETPYVPAGADGLATRVVNPYVVRIFRA